MNSLAIELQSCRVMAASSAAKEQPFHVETQPCKFSATDTQTQPTLGRSIQVACAHSAEAGWKHRLTQFASGSRRQLHCALFFQRAERHGMIPRPSTCSSALSGSIHPVWLIDEAFLRWQWPSSMAMFGAVKHTGRDSRKHGCSLHVCVERQHGSVSGHSKYMFCLPAAAAPNPSQPTV